MSVFVHGLSVIASYACPLYPKKIKSIGKVHHKLSSGNQIQEGRHIRISGIRIAPETRYRIPLYEHYLQEKTVYEK
jgi:hypothetical protein